MKILLLGANGQVGWELQRLLSPLGEIKACTRKEADLVDPNKLKLLIQSYQPEIIVNAAAYTSVDKAESEPEKAYSINTEAVAIMANEIKEFDGLLIYYSTDYIFDGKKTTPYTEKDQPNPQSVYGKTKHQGEVIIKASGCNHIIFRTSWVYALRGTNFVKTMIKLGKEREELKVVNDQIGVPTSAELIADITALSLYKIIQEENQPQKMVGTYHLTPMGETSWYSFAQFVFTEAEKHGEQLKVTTDKIIPITTSEYQITTNQKMAKRPANSRLDTKKILEKLGIHLPPWQVHAKRLIKELYES
jgi:dTDP-4-dehydrorhamnose reductase